MNLLQKEKSLTLSPKDINPYSSEEPESDSDESFPSRTGKGASSEDPRDGHRSPCIRTESKKPSGSARKKRKSKVRKKRRYRRTRSAVARSGPALTYISPGELASCGRLAPPRIRQEEDDLRVTFSCSTPGSIPVDSVTMSTWLKEVDLAHLGGKFIVHRINNTALLRELTDKDMVCMGIGCVGDRLRLRIGIRRLQQMHVFDHNKDLENKSKYFY